MDDFVLRPDDLVDPRRFNDYLSRPFTAAGLHLSFAGNAPELVIHIFVLIFFSLLSHSEELIRKKMNL